MTLRYQKIRGFITNSNVRFRIGYAIKIYSLKGLLTHKIIFSICKHERMANCCGCFFVNGRVVESKNGVTIDQHDCCRKPHSMFTTSCKEELRKIIKGKKRIYRTGRQFFNCAVKYGHDTCVDELIKAGADMKTRAHVQVMRYDSFQRRWHKRYIHEKSYLHDPPLLIAVLHRNEKCVSLLLKGGAWIRAPLNRPFPFYFQDYAQYNCDDNIGMMLFAAGASVNSEHDREDTGTPDSQFCLKHLCRVKIRKHLVYKNRNLNLFQSVPRLELPSLLQEYLLYNISL